MVSLLTRIEDELDASGVATALTEQIGKLGDAGGLLGDLASPPAELGELITALQALSLPDIEALQGLVGDVRGLVERLPSDPAELTGALSEGLGGLATTVQDELIAPLTSSFDVIQAVAALIQGDKGQPSGAPGGDGVAVPALAAAGLRPLAAPASTNGPSPAGTRPARAAAAAAATTPPAVGAIAQASQALSEFPSPLTVESFLRFLRDLLRAIPPELIPAQQLPIFTEFQQRLDTILAWDELDAAGLAGALVATLRSLAQFIRLGVLSDVAQTAATIQGITQRVPLETLRNPMQAIDLGLRELADVVQSGNLSTVGTRITQLNALVAQVNALAAVLRTDVIEGPSDALVRTLTRFPDQLDSRMREVLMVLKPPSDFGVADDLAEAIDGVFNQAEADELVARVQELADWLKAIVDRLDLEAVREPIQTIVEGAQSATAELDDLLIGLTGSVKVLFDDVDALVNGLDVAAVTQAVEQALTDLREAIEQQVNALFQPVGAALSEAIEALETAASTFTVEAVIDTLRDAIERLGNVLSNPEVADALESARQVLDEATQALQSLSFEKVTDAVVSDIEGVTGALKKIDPDSLPDPLRIQLKSVVAVLPTDFTPIAGRVTETFDELVEAGPKPLLLAIQDGPDRVATRIQELAPEKLIGDQLSAPYQAFVGELAAFKPSGVLAPVEEALEDLKSRLEKLSPGALLEPLDELHAELVAAFGKLDPAALIQPLSEQISVLVDGLVERLPTDALFDQVDAVLASLQSTLASVDAARALLRSFGEMIEGLSSPEQQVQQLLDPILDRVGQIPNVAVLQPAFAEVRAAVTAVRGAQLQPALLGPLDGLVARLDALNPTQLHGAVARAYRDFPRAAVEALPPSAQRTQILDFLNAFDPLSPAIARPFTALQALRDQVDAARGPLLEVFAGWDGLYHRPDGPFAEFLRDGITTAQLREILAEAITSTFARPLTAIFGLLARVGGVVGSLVDALDGLVEHVQGRLASLLLIPEAFGAIRTALDELLGTIQAFDLSFLADEAQETFALVRMKLEALDPSQIRAAVDATFDALIAVLRLDALLPQDAIADLDRSYAQIVDTLRALDPTKHVIEVVQPDFEAAIKPLLDVVFEVSELIKVLVERLDGLGAELGQGLTRTGDAFGKMVKAIPA